MTHFISLFLIAISFLPANKTDKSIIDAFNKINPNPQVQTFTNNIEINNNGGHIQGIQSMETEKGTYLFMTGSSDSYAYLCIVKNDNGFKMIAVNRLMDKPFKHAGGFQIYKNLLAVGIEDNTEKDKSKVCIYDISNPESPAKKPVTIIERNGEPMRSTAGCVAIAEYKNKTLLAVGDWDTKHIDFYTGNLNETPVDFQQTGSIDTELLTKSGWSDKHWNPYQNINLFNIDGTLYLIGLGQNRKAQNIADLYRLLEDKAGNFSLTKLSSIIVNCTKECSFKAAAGAEYKNGEFHIIASGYTILETSVLNYFQP